MYAMKEGSEAKFGKGYNVLPIWKKRLNAKTLVTTPNSDVIYAMGYLDLKQDGPIVIEAPPGLQGILDDFFQRPIPSEGRIDGRMWYGDVGLPGPDKGKGGKSSDPAARLHGQSSRRVLDATLANLRRVRLLARVLQGSEATRLAGEGHAANAHLSAFGKAAKAMQFPDASGVPVNMLYPRDGSAFDLLKRAIDAEYVDPADLDMRGMLAAIGIVKDQPFSPDGHTPERFSIAPRAAPRRWPSTSASRWWAPARAARTTPIAST